MVWIGLNRNPEDNQWYWINGTKATNKTIAKIHNKQTCIRARRCAALGLFGETDKSLQCSEKYRALCEVKKNSH